MRILKGDVLNVDGITVEVENFQHIDGLGWHVKFKNNSTLYPVKRLNAAVYKGSLVRRGENE